MNAENFANFGIRLLEIMSLEFHKEILQSDILDVVIGLLRTNDYETIVQCLSFIKVIIENANSNENFKIEQALKPKLLALVLKTVGKHSEIEFVNLTLEIVNLSLPNKELRNVIINTPLSED